LNNGTLNASPSVILNFTNGLFQWGGGVMAGVITNANQITIRGSANKVLQRNSVFNNKALLRHTDAGRLDLLQNSSFENLSSGVYDLASDGGLFSDDYAPQFFDNFGLFRKSAGTNTSVISTVLFNNHGGTIEVDSGTLSLANNGSSSNATITVAAGGVLDVTGGQVPTWAGSMTGSGSGAILFSSGILNTAPSAVFDFAGQLFQWTAGKLSGILTNVNQVNLSGVGAKVLDRSSRYNNASLTRQTGGSFDLLLNSRFENLATGTYDMSSDGRIYTDDYQPQSFDNFGLFRVSAGTNSSINTVLFNNLGGTVEVDSGTLSLGNNGNSTNGTISVAADAVLDVAGGQNPAWYGTTKGTGAGTVVLANGSLHVGGALNFAGNLFQWRGGLLTGTPVNSGQINLNGSVILDRSSQFTNLSLVRQVAGGCDVRLNSSIENMASGTYEFAGDASVYTDDYNPQSFDNFGLIRKSAGTNSSTISIAFANHDGSLEVDSGTLSLNGSAFAQGAGSIAIQLNGTNAGQFGQLKAGSVSLSGPLTLKLTNGFAPPIGSVFQIISCSSLTGVFSSLNVPNGITVNYTGNGVVAVVTGQISKARTSPPAQPKFTISRLTGNQATLQWAGDTNIVVETATSLAPDAVWAPVSNVPLLVSSNNFQLNLPVTNTGQYFRLRKR
jgi:hypothetical protein